MKNTIPLLFAGITLLSCQKKEDKTVVQETTVEQTTPATKQCYLKITGSKDETGKTVNDTLQLTIETKGDSVSGEFKWLPYYKDKKKGIFKGTVNGHTANTLLMAQAEGTTNKEEFIFDFNNEQATVKFGEMTKGEDGIWYYTDKNTLSKEKIPKVECK